MAQTVRPAPQLVAVAVEPPHEVQRGNGAERTQQMLFVDDAEQNPILGADRRHAHPAVDQQFGDAERGRVPVYGNDISIYD